MEGGWFDTEAIEAERFDADMEMARFEEEGARYAARSRRSAALRAAGDLEGAAEACPHGSGYPLNSLAAEHSADPYSGCGGWRCSECGSRLTASTWDGGDVQIACEIEGRA